MFAGIKVREQELNEQEAKSSITGRLRKTPRSLSNSLSRKDGEKIIIKRLSERILQLRDSKVKTN